MFMTPKQIGWAAVAGGLLSPAAACNVPVFRYALERWSPDPYVVVVFSQGPLARGPRSLVEALERAKKDDGANVVVLRADISREMSTPLRAVWNSQSNAVPPWVVVRYPAQTGIQPAAWSGPLSAEVVAALVESPARRELARRLCQGDTAVWLLLESGDKARDQALAEAVDKESRRLEQSLELPVPAPGDPPMASDVPLHVAFSTMRVARSDPAERWLVAQLMNWNPRAAIETRPMLFPVFGRGRMLPPAIGPGIRSGTITAMATALTGPCSCQFKEMNPGFDLLMGAKWDALLEGHGAKPAEPPPPLTSLSQFAAVAGSNSAALPGRPAGPAAAADPPSAPAWRGRLAWNLAMAVAIGAVALGAATLALKAAGRPGS